MLIWVQIFAKVYFTYLKKDADDADNFADDFVDDFAELCTTWSAKLCTELPRVNYSGVLLLTLGITVLVDDFYYGEPCFS